MTTIDPAPTTMGGPLSEADRAEVLVEGSWFKVDDLPEILGNFMRSNDEYAREAKALSMKLAETRARVGVLEGQLATARALHKPLPVRPNSGPGRSYGECLGNGYSAWPCATAKALGLDGGDPDER